MNMRKQGLSIVLLICTFVSGGLLAQDSDVKIESLDPIQFYEKLQRAEHALLVDTRSYSEFKKSRLPDAIHAPERKVLFPLLDEMQKNQPIFVYCGRGFESAIVCKIITGKGFRHVYSLRGGFYAWVKKDMPLDKERIHGKKNEQ